MMIPTLSKSLGLRAGGSFFLKRSTAREEHDLRFRSRAILAAVLKPSRGTKQFSPETWNLERKITLRSSRSLGS